MFEAPQKDALIKVTAINVAFYLSPSKSAEQAYKINPAKENGYTPWSIGDTVKATGNVLNNSEGTWIEALHFRWYRKNFLSAWFPVALTIYYRAEDQAANWISSTVIGVKPPITTPSGNGGTPEPEKEQDNTLQKISIGIGIVSLIIALRK